jgi:hypothetical protein
MPKYLAAVALLFSSSVFGQTVIYYEDGSVYTLKPNENVFVSTVGKMYRKQSYKNGNVHFKHLLPNEEVDYEAQPYDGIEKGSEEWCEAYAPYLYVNGYTFDDQTYERACKD